MTWYLITYLVQKMITFLQKDPCKNEWAEALIACLERAERVNQLEEVVVDLRQRLEEKS